MHCFIFWSNNNFDKDEIEKHKARVFLCKRLSGQWRDVSIEVYFHLYWWWWAVLGCTVVYWAALWCNGLYWAVLGYTGLYWAVLGCTRLYWTVLGCTGMYWDVLGCTGLYWTLLRCTGLYWAVISYFSVYSAIFGMVTNKRQPGDPSASLLLTSVRRQSFAIIFFVLNSFNWTCLKPGCMSTQISMGAAFLGPTSPLKSNWWISLNYSIQLSPNIF